MVPIEWQKSETDYSIYSKVAQNLIFWLLDTNIQDIALGIILINDQLYQWLLDKNHSHYILAVTNISDPLSLNYKQGYLRIHSLQKYFLLLRVSYINNIVANCYYNTCKLAKKTKYYNQISRSWPEVKYSDIHTNLVGPITSHGFQGEKYFFTFTDGITQETDTFTSYEKCAWFERLKTFYARE